MRKSYRFGGLLAALLLSVCVYAGDIQIEGAWSRATAPGQDMASLDMSITSKQAATLLGVSSTASRTVEMHSMTHENGVMKMREVKAIELPAGKHKQISLGESGYHLMLVGLKAPLKAGEDIPLTLSIKVANDRTVKVEARAEVKPLTATKDTMHEHGHEHQH